MSDQQPTTRHARRGTVRDLVRGWLDRGLDLEATWREHSRQGRSPHVAWNYALQIRAEWKRERGQR